MGSISQITKRRRNLTNMWPTIFDENNKKVYDLPSRLLKDRIILLNETITDQTAASITAQLMYLNMEDKKKAITMYINSPGGSVSAGFAIYDMMKNIEAPVITIANGMVASMAAFLLSAGDKGMRYAMPNSTIMIHQPLGGTQGQATEIEICARRILKIREKIYKIMASVSNKDVAYFEDACERDNYLEPEEALKIGLIDKILPAVKN